MKRLKLVTKSIRGVGTFGELFDGEKLICVTVEQIWNNNKKAASCVPAGLYQVRRHTSPRFGDCFSISNPDAGVTVSGPSLRDNCLFHAANYPKDVKGCIGPGDKFMTGTWGVSNSRKTLDMLKEKYPEGFDMEIIRL
ncbi:hypothetical protein DMW20_11860 [Vibrio parahaemolyticus]|nr:hypothetical protein [Vibrio parahaemolyticus]